MSTTPMSNQIEGSICRTWFPEFVSDASADYLVRGISQSIDPRPTTAYAILCALEGTIGFRSVQETNRTESSTATKDHTTYYPDQAFRTR